jgi:hypothetical protein
MLAGPSMRSSHDCSTSMATVLAVMVPTAVMSVAVRGIFRVMVGSLQTGAERAWSGDQIVTLSAAEGGIPPVIHAIGDSAVEAVGLRLLLAGWD